MNVVYNSDNYYVVEFAEPRGFELVDKHSRRSTFFHGDVAEKFAQSLAKGDYRDAASELEKLRKQLDGGKLSEEQKQKLTKQLDIFVWHDDQQGTATVILAGLINALKIAGKKLSGTQIAVIGAGAAGIPTARLLMVAELCPLLHA